MTTATETFELSTAPMRIGTVRLKVRDLPAVSGFYQDSLGLRRLDASDRSVTLGTSGRPLLHLERDPALAQRDPRQAGLFHTAFLMPTRADLARWLTFVAEAHVPLQGASDHVVSEAIYLADPEGNGIEVYADRPVSHWRTPEGEIHMATERLDMQDLLSAAGGRAWAGFPADGLIGHVHLQVGDTTEAERFYGGILGFDIASRYPGASFFGSGGYHHQLAGNVWNSRGAGERSDDMAGLDEVEVVVRDATAVISIAERAEAAGVPVTRNGDALTLRDPWGTLITVAH
jgi:catechol 2,3-dioxygenase